MTVICTICRVVCLIALRNSWYIHVHVRVHLYITLGMGAPGGTRTHDLSCHTHSTPSPIGISHLASQVWISHHYTRSHLFSIANSQWHNLMLICLIMVLILVVYNNISCISDWLWLWIFFSDFFAGIISLLESLEVAFHRSVLDHYICFTLYSNKHSVMLSGSRLHRPGSKSDISKW